MLEARDQPGPSWSRKEVQYYLSRETVGEIVAQGFVILKHAGKNYVSGQSPVKCFR